MSVERQYQQFETFEGRFRPTSKRLHKVAEQGTALLEAATEDQFGVLTEHT